MSLLSCARVLLSEGYSGTVVDAETKTPLPNVAVEITVTRVSSFDGPSVFRTDRYTTNESGEFLVPNRKKIVESVPEKSEEMRYFETIRFTKAEYETLEFRTEERSGSFKPASEGTNLVIQLKKTIAGK